MMCLVATESLSNMQYLNINHSDIASTIYSEMSSSYIPNWIVKFNKLDRSLLIFPWGIFHTNQISSLYLDNYGDSLTAAMVNLGLFIIFGALALSQDTKKLTNSFLGKVYVTTFSLFTSTILGTIQSQLLFSILQLLKFDLLFDAYSVMSLLVGYFTLSFSIGLTIFCFFRTLTVFKRKTIHWRPKISDKQGIKRYIQIKWFEKKYEFLFQDLRSRNRRGFFFAFWLTAFNAIYILLIVSLQSIPILQCLSIVIVALSFILFPVMNDPFKKKLPRFLHYFNFSCLLIAAILNMILAIIQSLNSSFSGAEIQGWMVVSVIFINTGLNTLISLGLLILDIYRKIRNSLRSKEPPRLSHGMANSVPPASEINELH